MGWRFGPLIGVTINCRTLPQLRKAARILAKQGAPMDQGQQKRAASVKKGNKKGNEVRMRPTRQFLATQRGRVCLWAAVSPCQSACGFLRPGRWAGIRTSSDAAGGVTRPARFSRPWFPTDRGCLSKPARTSRLSVAKYSGPSQPSALPRTLSRAHKMTVKRPSALSRTLTRALNITATTVIAGQVKPIRTTGEQPVPTVVAGQVKTYDVRPTVDVYTRRPTGLAGHPHMVTTFRPRCIYLLCNKPSDARGRLRNKRTV